VRRRGRSRFSPRGRSARTSTSTSRTSTGTALLAVRRAVLTDLAGALEPATSKQPSAAGKARKAAVAACHGTVKAAPSRTPSRSSARAQHSPTRSPLELSVDSDSYPDTVIVDPDAILGAHPPATPSPGCRRTRSRAAVHVDRGKPTAIPQRAPDPVPRAGEEVLERRAEGPFFGAVAPRSRCRLRRASARNQSCRLGRCRSLAIAGRTTRGASRAGAPSVGGTSGIPRQAWVTPFAPERTRQPRRPSSRRGARRWKDARGAF
jgi:hypothetical protein